MSRDEEMHDFFRKSAAIQNDPQFQACMDSVKRIAGYELHGKYEAAFQQFQNYLINPEPRFITELRANPKKQHWYQLLQGGVLDNVKLSFSCVLYHQGRLVDIEKRLVEVIRESDIHNKIGNLSVGLGGTSVLDFEYQAYVLAYRRCLDQFAVSLAAFFKNKYSSFRTLPDFLSRRKPELVAKSISEVHSRYAKHFEFVFSDGGVTSVRDRIAHYEFVTAGCVNISEKGVSIAGGGENLNDKWYDPNSSLADVLCPKTEILYDCIAEMIRTFVQTASEWDDAVREESGGFPGASA